MSGSLDQILATLGLVPTSQMGMAMGGGSAQALGADLAPVQPAQPGSEMPGVGFLPGQLFLNPAIAPKVPAGAPARPFAPGEYVRNPNGGWSSEISVTVEDPRLNGGKPTIVPSLWVVDGKAKRVDEDTAADYAAASGLPFQGYDSIDAAEAAATSREDNWQKLDQSKPETASTIPALWGTTPAPAAGAPPKSPVVAPASKPMLGGG